MILPLVFALVFAISRRGRRPRSATKKHTQRSKRTTVVIETQGRGPKRTTVYEEVYEEEWCSGATLR